MLHPSPITKWGSKMGLFAYVGDVLQMSLKTLQCFIPNSLEICFAWNLVWRRCFKKCSAMKKYCDTYILKINKWFNE